MMYNIEAAEFEIKRLQEVTETQRLRIAELEAETTRLCLEKDKYLGSLQNIADYDEDDTVWDKIQSARSALGLDSNGNEAPFQPGDRVIFLPEKTLGTVEKQTLHYDCDERFWGNLMLKMDNGTRLHCNCWQTRKLDQFGNPVEDRIPTDKAIKIPKITKIERH